MFEEARHFLAELAARPLSPEESRRAMALHDDLEATRETSGLVVRFTRAAQRAAALPQDGGHADVSRLAAGLVESLHLVLLTMKEAAKARLDREMGGAGPDDTGPDETDGALLRGLTADRGGVMDRLRQRCFFGETPIPAEDRPLVLELTDTFQRTLWLLRRRIEGGAENGSENGTGNGTAGGTRDA